MAKKLTPLSEWAAQRGMTYHQAWKLAKAGQIRTETAGRFLLVVEEEAEASPKPKGAYTFFTHAGGAGKTSLTRDLGYEMASRGYRVLLVDADPQANLTAWLGMNDVDPEEDTLLRFYFREKLPEPRQVLEGLDLVPSHVNLAEAEVKLGSQSHLTLALRGALEEWLERYDLIFLDSLPSLGPLAISAALAGQGLLVPVELSRKSIQALEIVLRVAASYARTLSLMRLWSGGSFIRAIFPNQAEGTVRDREIMDYLREEVASIVPVAEPLTRRPAVYREAQASHTPVQLVGDEEVRRQLRLLGDFFVEEVLQGVKEEVGA
ncbi:ParA family protein [Thermus hydrothermalis]|uniref:ParA family protein n=1 Tax=Thermus hydrothermalis TaxID=2908148 RepID=UPI001FA96599|nr:ParA family protein [Thermus hydrothermalis]